MLIKEITEIKDEITSEIKTKLVFSENGVDTEIMLEGDGKLKVATSV